MDGFKRSGSSRNITTLLLFVLLAFSVSSLLVDFVDPTLSNGSSTSDTSIIINTSINIFNLSNIVFDWNGTNYTLYNESLIMAYNFNNISSLGDNNSFVTDFGMGSKNANVSGAVWTPNGKYGGAYEFNGENALTMTFISPQLLESKGYTFMVWAYPRNMDGDSGASRRILRSDLGTFIGVGDNLLKFLAYNSSGNAFTMSKSASVNQWYHLVGTCNATGFCAFYVNGVQEGTSNIGTVRDSGNNFTIGAGSSSSGRFNGTIDEVRVFRHYLTSDEVLLYYHSNIEKKDPFNWTLHINQTNLSISNYTYQVFIANGTGSVNKTEIRTVIISTADNGAPSVTVNYPLNQYYNGRNITFNVTVNETGNCSYSLDGGINNISMNNVDGFNFTAFNETLLDNKYTVNFYCNDSSGNYNRTESVIFYVDNTLPVINFLPPTPVNNTQTINTTMIINMTLNELGLKKFFFTWNDSNYTHYDKSLVLKYQFDNLSSLGENNSYVVDLSSRGNDGTVYGAVANNSGKYGGSFEFDGADDFIDAGNDSSLNLNYSFSILTWVKAKNLDPALNIIVSKDDGQGGVALGIADLPYELRLSNAGTSHGLLTPDIRLNSWMHIAATYNSSESKVRYYLDGVFKGSFKTNFNFSNNTRSVLIGRRNDTWFFNGSIDNVELWNTTLSSTEIESHYFSNLKKYNLTHWEFLINRSGIADNNYNLSAYVDDQLKNYSKITQNFSVLNENPQITLNEPSAESTGVSTTATLGVTVSDTEGKSLDVKYYGVNSNTTYENFSIVVLPDTQMYSEDYPNIFTNQTKWIVELAQTETVAYVIHTGDIVNVWNNETQWQNANNSLNYLDNNSIPYSVVTGNHDNDNGDNNTFYDKYFPASRFNSNSWYGGNYTNNRNHYDLISAGGQDLIILHLGMVDNAGQPYTDIPTSWANDTLKAYPNHKAILVTHAYMDKDGTYIEYGQNLYSDLVVQNENVFMVLCGHMHDSKYQVKTIGDRKIYEILIDYQGQPNGGNGWLRKYVFSPEVNMIYATTYSPYVKQYNTSSNNKFTIESQMHLQELDSSDDLSSGSSTTYSWSGLSASTTYLWKVVVTDEDGRTNTSTIWNFTTAAASSDEDLDSGSSSSGSSGGGVSNQVPNKYKKMVWGVIGDGAPTTLDINDQNIGITSVRFLPTKDLFGLWIKVEKKDELATKINPFSKKIYQYLEITKSLSINDRFLGDKIINFRVKSSWLNDNELNKENIALFRYVNNEWVELSTTILNTENGYINYVAETPGFSYFAIGESEHSIVHDETIVTKKEADDSVEKEIKQTVPKSNEENGATFKSNDLVVYVSLFIIVIISIFLYINIQSKKKK
jgi:PGF-pre-PGF domain-containing protein